MWLPEGVTPRPSIKVGFFFFPALAPAFSLRYIQAHLGVVGSVFSSRMRSGVARVPVSFGGLEVRLFRQKLRLRMRPSATVCNGRQPFA